jgi:hypothetical protein
MTRVALVGLVMAGVIVGLWVSQCSGPRPELVGAPVLRAPTQPGAGYHVEAVVRNAGPGHGEVQIVARLRDRATGRTYQRDETGQLEAGEQAGIVVEIFAPPADYEPQVEVTYPPG